MHQLFADNSLISLCASQHLPYFWQIDKASSGFASHISLRIFMIVSVFQYSLLSDVSHGSDDWLTSIRVCLIGAWRSKIAL